MEPNPGDFFVVSIPGFIGWLIRLGQWLAGGGWSDYQHAGIYVGDGLVVEAEPGGARLARLEEYDGHAISWSTAAIRLTDAQRTSITGAAYRLARDVVPYSALDYFAIAAHRFRLPVPFLRRYIASTHHMICSQLVDWCWQQGGVNLFPGRWDGYVMPADLGSLITDLIGKRLAPALVSASR